MRVPELRLAPWLALALFVLVAPAVAATPVQDDCDWDKVQQLEATTLLHPQLFFEAQRPLMESNRWLDVLRHIKEDFAAAPVPHDDNRARFLAQIEALEREFEEVTRSPDFEQLAQSAQKVTLARFRLVRDPDEDRMFLFFRRPEQITIDASMPGEVRRQYCWRALSIQRILTQYGEKGRAAAALALQTYVAQWDAYNENGYLQFPWELYLNGRWSTDRNSLAPPRRQWIIAHPNLAVEQAGHSFEKSRIDEVLAFEPVGYLWYTEDRRSYYGIAALLTFPSGRDVGRGLLLHFGKMAKLGYVWRDRDELNRRQNGIVFTMDLYQLLADPPQGQQDGRARAKAVLEKLLDNR